MDSRMRRSIAFHDERNRIMNEIAAMFCCVGASLFWAAWRESRAGNKRDRTLLALFGVTVTSASALLAVIS